MKHYVFIFSLLTFAIANADSMQTVEVMNNSAQILYLNANNADRSFSFNQTVPAYAKSLVLVQVTQLKNLQDMLFEGILNNSSEEIRRAIQAGANVNLEREGKRPLVWAISFQRINAARVLIDYGAF